MRLEDLYRMLSEETHEDRCTSSGTKDALCRALAKLGTGAGSLQVQARRVLKTL